MSAAVVVVAAASSSYHREAGRSSCEFLEEVRVNGVLVLFINFSVPRKEIRDPNSPLRGNAGKFREIRVPNEGARNAN